MSLFWSRGAAICAACVLRTAVFARRLDAGAARGYTESLRGVAQLVAHRVWDAGARGSSPRTPTGRRASPSGKASAFQADIHGFESRRPL